MNKPSTNIQINNTTIVRGLAILLFSIGAFWITTVWAGVDKNREQITELKTEMAQARAERKSINKQLVRIEDKQDVLLEAILDRQGN